MLTHTHENSCKPSRVVLLGGSGFVGQAIADQLQQEGIAVRSFSSAELDLTQESSVQKLAGELKADDSLVILSALTPDKGRDIATFMRNLRMIEHVCKVLAEVTPAHVVYFSSDAVYPLSVNPVSEDSPAAPGDLYGTMHLAREVMLKDAVAERLCILRPTLIYGAADTHNSYGPNRFRRQAAEQGKIVIGGEGEETRDHIFVEDVARLVELILGHASVGLVNIATGQSTDFGTVARWVAAEFGEGVVEVCPTERNNAITYRSFDISTIRKAFPGFLMMPLQEGIARVHREVFAEESA